MLDSHSSKHYHSDSQSDSLDWVAVLLIAIDLAVLMLMTVLFAQGWIRIDSALYLS
jgi:hypothetical protein